MNAQPDPAEFQIERKWITGTWTEDMLRTMLTLRDARHSASEIARELPGRMSRNAVIGKVHRMGLKLISDSETRTRKSQGLPSRAKPARQRMAESRARKRMQDGLPPSAPVQTAPRLDATDMRLLTLEDLNMGGARHCRWIEGDPRESHFYCGNDAKAGSSYCPAHHAVVWVKGSKPDTRMGRGSKNGRPTLLFGTGGMWTLAPGVWT
jgi:hypothetical protein